VIILIILKTINIFQKKKESGGAVNNQQEHWTFVYDKVLQNVSQEIVYDEVAQDVVHSVLEGVNGN
jgi:kinesin family protein 6/9